jgi:hypothetical protein
MQFGVHLMGSGPLILKYDGLEICGVDNVDIKTASKQSQRILDDNTTALNLAYIFLPPIRTACVPNLPGDSQFTAFSFK